MGGSLQDERRTQYGRLDIATSDVKSPIYRYREREISAPNRLKHTRLCVSSEENVAGIATSKEKNISLFLRW